ncbi:MULTISPECIES: DUF6908 domain-containing protein [Cytobacillus]|uniref:DUF6908 domain-containing protein n=1 Tax=Cytobacillus oceanisediminis TaxID=665099 RepID=A0ABX3CMY2_9BACI|nr:hypothetical protein [Cytobacillus oceanisediminis]EFV75016.1 hypothetical protein HMPREF1013_04789 [Bacillus sp. 2_A_57_CT2]MCM3402942.1 hypothetical protein [Cytobacillus oceanisediminis]OHX45029.1 hypothetical protein BBV17_24200 [Cytobacillus oceanisediminis]
MRNQPTTIYNHLEKIFTRIGKSYKDMGLGESISLESGGLMDFVISRIDTDVLALEHNYVQNGDIMVDPRNDVRIVEHCSDLKLVEALNYEQHNLGLYCEIYTWKDDKCFVDTRLRNEVNNFLCEWLQNINSQGYSLKPQNAQLSS